jgi:aspartate aminotransferase
MLSERVRRITDSPTLAVSARAKALKAEGRDIVNLSAGEPDFPPPEDVRDAAIEALRKGSSGYTPAAGTPGLRKVVCEKLRRDNGLEYAPGEVMITAGAKQALYNIFQAILDKGDDVVIPRPYWVSYPDMAKLADGTPVFAEPGEGFSLKAESVLERFTDRTKAVVLNSPNNPSGAVFPQEEMRKVCEEAAKRGIFIISDEIYEWFVYDGSHFSPASMSDEVKSVTFTVNGISKSHSVPGWRLGYVAGPEEAVRSMARLQSQSTSNPCSISQEAAMAALVGPGLPDGMLGEYRERRDLLVKGLNSLEGFSCHAPRGAFYTFPRIPERDDLAFSTRLLEEAGVAVVPGSAFGMPGHVRMSYAASRESIEKGLERMGLFLRR